MAESRGLEGGTTATLPVRPLIVVPLFLFLVFVPFVGIPFDGVENIGVVTGTVAFLLYFGWLYSVVSFVSALPIAQKRGSAARYRRVTLCLFSLTAALFTYAVFYDLYLDRYVSDTPLASYIGTQDSLLALATCIIGFCFFWYVARALREAEEQRALPAAYVVLTFFLFFYPPFSIPLVYNRLKRLRPDGSEPHTQIWPSQLGRNT